MAFTIRTLSLQAIALLMLIGCGGADSAAEAPRRGPTPRPNPATSPAKPALQAIPHGFIPNHGQWKGPQGFAAWIGDTVVALDAQGLRSSRRCGDSRASVGLRFVGAHATVRLRGESPQPTVVHVYKGRDPTRWRRGLPVFASVLYEDLYDGIDVRVRLQDEQLEYDVILQPGAELADVVVRVDGASGMDVDASGSLVIETPCGPVRQHPPLTWQVLPDGARRPVTCRFRAIEADRYGFESDALDPALMTVVDPGLDWATYLGGSGVDTIHGVTVFPDGDVLVVGELLDSLDFPTTPGALFEEPPSDCDGFISRLSSDGSTLLMSTFVGGSLGDRFFDVTLAPNGDIVAAGASGSSDFPVIPEAFQTVVGDFGSGVVFRMSPEAELVFGSFIGSAAQVKSVRFDAQGRLVVAGNTNATDFPTTPGAFQPALSGPPDAFIARFNLVGNNLDFATYLGGDKGEDLVGLELTSDGRIVVGGNTSTLGDFPMTPGAFDPDTKGSFVSCLSKDGDALLWSTSLGKANDVTGIALGPGDDVFAVGTADEDFETTDGAFNTHFQGAPGFGSETYVARLTSDGSALVYASWIWFNGTYSHAVEADASGVATVVGQSDSSTFKATDGAFQEHKPGGIVDDEGFVIRVSPDGARLLYATYLGAVGDEGAKRVALTANGDAIVTGFSDSLEYPVTEGAFQTRKAVDGTNDATIARLDLLPADVRRFGAATPGCSGPLHAGVTSRPRLGTRDFALTCTQAPPASTNGLMILATSPRAAALPILGFDLWVEPASILALIPAVTTPDGWCEVDLALAPDRFHVGQQLYAQFVWSDPCVPGATVAASDAIEVRIAEPRQ